MSRVSAGASVTLPRWLHLLHTLIFAAEKDIASIYINSPEIYLNLNHSHYTPNLNPSANLIQIPSPET